MIHTQNPTLKLGFSAKDVTLDDIRSLGFSIFVRSYGSERGYQPKDRYRGIYNAPRKGIYVYAGKLHGHCTDYVVRQYIEIEDNRTGVIYDNMKDFLSDNPCFDFSR